MADGLLGFDPTTLQAFAAQFAPSEDEKQKARMQGIMSMGLALLGARKGQELPALGQAGLLGMGQMQDSLKQFSQQRRDALTSATQAMSLQEMMRKYTDENAARQATVDFYKGQGQPSVAPAPQSVAMGPPGPDGMQVQPSANVAPNVATSAISKQSKFEQYSSLAQMLSSRGLVDQAQKAADIAEKYRPKLKDTKTMTQNGQRVSVNIYDDGTTSVVPFGPDQEKAHFLDNGQQVGAVDPFSGQPIPGGGMYQKQQTPDAIAARETAIRGQDITAQGQRQSNALGYAHLTETQRHNQMVEGDPATIEQTAQGIAAGNLAPLSGFALGRPMGQQVMARVMQINPDYSGKDFGTGQKAEKDFATGKQGNTIRSLNVAVNHLDTFSQLAAAMHNGDMPLVNKLGNIVAQQTGAPAPTNFNAAKQIIGDEIVKAVVGAGGTGGDRDKAQQSLNAANSPAQLAGVISTYQDLMRGQLGGLRQQYETATKRNDFDRFLTGAAKATIGGGADVRKRADDILNGIR